MFVCLFVHSITELQILFVLSTSIDKCREFVEEDFSIVSSE